MGEKFGARLRQCREAHGIALDAVVRQTKIKRSLLEALERDDVSGWPRGCFRRGFIRAYAQVIGIDPEDAVREFLTDFPECAPIVDPSVATAPPLEPAPVELPHEDGALLAVAPLCTALGRIARAEDLRPLLGECACLLKATGVIVWIWDEAAEELRPALSHGYSDGVLARLPAVTRDSDNATAEAFRTERTCTINGNPAASSALVIPLLTPVGCSGALAIEFAAGAEQTSSVRAMSTIVAAMLAQMFNGDSGADMERLASRESA